MEAPSDALVKARQLESLVQECLHDDPLPNATKITHAIVSQRLLSEVALDGPGSESMEIWKRAFDLWQEKLFALVSTNEFGECWLGTLLLGMTFQHSSSLRFERSYALWFNKLLPQVKLLPLAPVPLQGALCGSLSDLFTRLASGEFPDRMRDGESFAGKLVLPLLELFSQSNSQWALEGASHLMRTLVNFFPAPVRHHSEAFEASIVKNLLSEKDDEKLRMLAECLTQVLKSEGDKFSWPFNIKKLLISIHLHLNYMFKGLEEDSICDEAIRCLVPPGMDHPPPLGGHKVSAEAAESASKGLLLCCMNMLTGSYPDQVSQVLPYISKIVRLLKEYFNRCALPKLRMKIYSNLQFMLQNMGRGLAVRICEFVTQNAFADLKPVVSSKKDRSSYASDSISMMIAALRAIEALLLADGASRDGNLRSRVDDLLIDIANAACEGGWEQEVVDTNSADMIWSDFQLASLKAIRTSFITCTGVQPTHLAEGLELFQRGNLIGK